MTPNVVTIVQEALRPEVLVGAGERLGVEPNALNRAATAAVPAVLRRLIARGGAPGGTEALLAAMRETGAARALADPLGRLQPDARPDAALLGDDLSGRLAVFGGLGVEAASALLAMVTPLALGAFARIAPTPLTPDTLGRTLREQENNVDRAFPPGFDLGGADAAPAAPAPQAASASAGAAEAADRVIMAESAAVSGGGEAVLFPAPGPALEARPPAAQPPAGSPSGSGGGLPKWLLPLLAALLLLAIVIFAFRSLSGEASAAEAYAALLTGRAAGSEGAQSQSSTSCVPNSGLNGYSAS